MKTVTISEKKFNDFMDTIISISEDALNCETKKRKEFIETCLHLIRNKTETFKMEENTIILKPGIFSAVICSGIPHLNILKGV